MREVQVFERDFVIVIICDQRALLQQRLGLHERFVGIVGEQTLIEVLGGRQRGPVPEQHVEKFEPVDVAAENHEAQRERRRQHEPDRPQIQLQKIAATITANGDSPVLCP